QSNVNVCQKYDDCRTLFERERNTKERHESILISNRYDSIESTPQTAYNIHWTSILHPKIDSNVHGSIQGVKEAFEDREEQSMSVEGRIGNNNSESEYRIRIKIITDCTAVAKCDVQTAGDSGAQAEAAVKQCCQP
ncbi:hypothetical protein NQ317_001832, partial [Molorchus minor]